MKRTVSAIALLSLFVTTVPAILCTAQSAGADTLKEKCSMRHGADRSGETPLGKQFKIPGLRSPAVQTLTDRELTARSTATKK